MQQHESHSDQELGNMPETASDCLSKAMLRRRSRNVPVVRCERFKWADKRKRKDYRSTGWLVDWRDPNDRRFRKRFSEERPAKLFASQKHAELLNAQRATRYVQTRLTDAQLDEVEGAFARLGTRYTLPQALDYFFGHFREADFRISLSKASIAFRGAMEGQVRDRTLVQLKSTLNQFEKFIEDCDLHEVTTREVERFLKSLRARDGANAASPKTWNNYRADLHLFFEWCGDKQRRWTAFNPAADTPRRRVETGHVDVLTLEQSRALMAYVSEHKAGKYARYFALGLFAGIRPGGELEKLAAHLHLIDLKNLVIRLSGAISKTGKARQIRIQPNLYEWLTLYPGDIFPVNCDRELKAIRKGFSLSHDVLRHSFCSAHVMAFGSFAETALESGNSEPIIRNHYLNTMSKDEAQAFWAIAPYDGDRKVVHLL
jgi:hypothetical protein